MPPLTAARCPYCSLAVWLERLPRHCRRCDWVKCPACLQVFAASKAPRLDHADE